MAPSAWWTSKTRLLGYHGSGLGSPRGGWKLTITRPGRETGSSVTRSNSPGIALAQGGAQVGQRALQQGHVCDGPGVLVEVRCGSEASAHEDGLEAICLPGDADGAVLLEHRPMVGATGSVHPHPRRTGRPGPGPVCWAHVR